MKHRDSAGQEQPQDDAQKEEKKRHGLHWSDIVEAVVDLIDAAVNWFN